LNDDRVLDPRMRPHRTAYVHARHVFGSLPIFFPLVVPPTSIGRRGHERIYTVAFGPMCLSACSACTSHLAATRNAQYGKRQRFGPMALGDRTYLRVVEPVPSSSPAVWEKSRYAQGAFIARARSDLLEVPPGLLPV